MKRKERLARKGKVKERDRKDIDRRCKASIVVRAEGKDEVARTETEADKIWKERKGKRDRVIAGHERYRMERK
jgi:hypothetical protein